MMNTPDASDREHPCTVVGGERENLRRERPVIQGGLAGVSQDVGQLMNEIRQANEELILAVVRAEDESGVRNVRARARGERDGLTSEIRGVTKRLSKAAADARVVMQRATRREGEYGELSRRLLDAQEEERRNLARDLHDTTQQSLAALAMHLDLVEKGASGLDVASRKALAESRSLAEQCSEELRTLSHLLHPPLLHELGLSEALSRCLSGFRQQSRIPVDFECDFSDRLPPAVETALFRVVQETLANVLRHSGSRSAFISLEKTLHAVTLHVRSQGPGVREELTQEGSMHPAPNPGPGIRGIRERIDQLGGTFNKEFTSHSSSIRVSVPLNWTTS
jgi:signal transduction histidine kinase